MNSFVGRHAAAVLISALASVGCTALPEAAPRELLDERTGVTITVVDEPLVFARERREVAANARDYVTLVAAAQNNAGRVSVALVEYRWSTIDERFAVSSDSAEATLKLIADGRDLAFTASEPFPSALSDPQNMLAPPASRYERRAYFVDHEALEFLANSTQISVQHGSDPRGFQVWRDGRAALTRFVKAVGSWDNRQR